MSSVFCSSCGHQNPPDSRFCAHCGAQLARAGAPVGDVPSDATSTISLSGIESLDVEGNEDLTFSDQAAVDSLPQGSAMLVVQRGPNAGSRFLLDEDVTTAGRHPESDIFLDDVTVSRRHAEFVRRDDAFSVRDVGSLNGTYLNRDRIDEAVLTGGDEVQVGKFRLVFLTSGDG
ncbi:MAG: zinc-ribbon and FHA domain-containing protein [Actinomycetota bacterium]|nr:zinc-ribbon and FHA domain-containing protein [Actinomycetota bacterium]